VANQDIGPAGSGRLGSTAAKGAAITLAGQGIRVGIQLLGIVLLARLLSPSDYGLLAMVVAIIGVGEVFRDFGLSSAAVQASVLTKDQRDNLFWINTGIGVGFAAVVVASSGLIAGFYSDSRLQPVAMVLSVTFVLNGLSTQFRADLNRRMRFGALAVVEILSSAAGLTIGILSALQGAGYWALVMQQVAGPAIGLIAVAVITRWIPGFPHRHSNMSNLLKFGGNLVAVQLLTYASRNIDSIVVGASFGASTLGFYDRAFQLLMLPLNQILAPGTKVALPILSQLQHDRARFSSFLARGQLALLHVIVAIFAIAAAQASPLILWVLGAQWQDSVPIFQILAVAGVAQAASYATYWGFLSLGLTGSNLRFALLSRPIAIAFILVGSLWGVHGVAAGFAVAQLLIWPLGLVWLSRATPFVPGRAMFINGLRTLAAYGACGVLSWLASASAASLPLIASFAIGMGTFFFAIFLLFQLWPSFRHDMRQLMSTVAMVRRPRIS
jgi:PST family polysaccharide transporter